MSEYSGLSKTEYIDLLVKKDLEIERLSLLLAMGKARTFGKKAETIDKEEMNLFNYNEVESLTTTTLEKEKQEIKETKERKVKDKNHSKIDFEKFVTETITHDPSADKEGSFENISDDVVYKAYVDVSIEITKHIFKTVKDSETGQILSELRDFPFNNSIATPSLVAYAANEKYAMGTPLYRQEGAFLSAGFPLSRVDLSNYLMKGAAILSPFYEYLKYLLINNQSKIVHADETTLKVINVGNKEKRDKCYMWMYATSANDLPIYIYEYRYSRSGAWPVNFLKNFKGYLVCDGYDGYNHIPNVKLQRCWQHAKRKFFDIYKANKDPKIGRAIELIDRMYAVERSFKENNYTAEQIKAARNQQEYLDLINGYFNYIESLSFPATSVTGKAVLYSTKMKNELLTILKDGNLPIENNLAERGIKPFVLARKNFLFSNTEKGADASSIYMSIVQTAKTSGLDVKKYLEHLFENLYKITIFESDYKDPKVLKDKFRAMECLLPWNENIVDKFKVKEVAR